MLGAFVFGRLLPRLFATLLRLIRLSPTNISLGDCRAQFKTPPAMYFEPAAFFMARSPTREDVFTRREYYGS
jgi:hypothetical protein